MRRTVGERAYDVMWKPLLISKFGEENYRDVNMAWMWARAYKRTARLGYFVGGFQGFIDLLVERVQAQGGTVRLNAHVRGIRRADGRVRLELHTGDVEYKHVIATCSPRILRERTPDEARAAGDDDSHEIDPLSRGEVSYTARRADAAS